MHVCIGKDGWLFQNPWMTANIPHWFNWNMSRKDLLHKLLQIIAVVSCNVSLRVYNPVRNNEEQPETLCLPRMFTNTSARWHEMAVFDSANDRKRLVVWPGNPCDDDWFESIEVWQCSCSMDKFMDIKRWDYQYYQEPAHWWPWQCVKFWFLFTDLHVSGGPVLMFFSVSASDHVFADSTCNFTRWSPKISMRGQFFARDFVLGCASQLASGSKPIIYNCGQLGISGK